MHLNLKSTDLSSFLWRLQERCSRWFKASMKSMRMSFIWQAGLIFSKFTVFLLVHMSISHSGTRNFIEPQYHWNQQRGRCGQWRRAAT